MDKECKKILNSPSDSPEAPGNETTESLDTNIKQVIRIIPYSRSKGQPFQTTNSLIVRPFSGCTNC